MIYTVTFNPSLDYIVGLDSFALGEVNRAKSEKIKAGGKGINVSFVLNNLGVPNTAFGFTAGFVGKEIMARISEKGIKGDFIELKEGCSRINVKVKAEEETELNGIGPFITTEAVDALYAKLDGIKKGDILVLSGSIPNTLSAGFYSDIMNYLKDRGILFVVDATKDLLMKSLDYHPFLIKPNNHELGDIFKVKLETMDEVIPYAQKLKEKGVMNVLVSMAEKGAVLIAGDGGVYRMKAPRINLVNSVGAGDSMVAGFIAGALKRGSIQDADYAYALKMGICTGSASASSAELATAERVNELLNTL